MSHRIVIVDLGIGNLRSVYNAILHLGYPAPLITNSIKEVETADVLILPGQGAFGTAMTQLHSLSIAQPVINHIQEQRPFLGICVGFQVLFEGSEEAPSVPGLGLFPGVFKPFPSDSLKVPQMGWNLLSVVHDPQALFSTLLPNPYVYFIHSFYVDVVASDWVSATSDYGGPFSAAIQQKNLLATQFHPEKSGDVGLTILSQFFKNMLPPIDSKGQ